MRYDFRNPEYLARREDHRRRARALCLYWAFPLFRETGGAEPGTRNAEPTESEILHRVEHAPLDDSILELAYGLVTRELVGVDPHRVGFTFGNSSPLG